MVNIKKWYKGKQCFTSKNNKLIAAAKYNSVKELSNLLGHEEISSRSDLLFAAAESNAKYSAKLLLKNGDDVDTSDSDGNTPLIKAACRGFDDIAHLLVRHGGADISTLWDGHSAAGLFFQCAV